MEGQKKYLVQIKIMSKTVLQIDNLSKMYHLGVINNGTLWQDIQTFFALKFGKEDPHSKIGEDKYTGDKDHFWALRDVSFDVKQGDRLGIIGKNGAGKSTLLKILSRITTPSEGTIKVKGKIASLLEVGTGFHGELTGRENIYLNGAILGMKKLRIDQLLDSIIDFSGIEQYIDTPVKRYSSGMFVRLAFAVAAHLDSDILIADEVLAVGDAEFQNKALGKMRDLSTDEGRTILFVSHYMHAVEKLCNSGIILEKGKIKSYSDEIKKLTNTYLYGNNISVSCSWENHNYLYDHINFTPIEFFIGDIKGNKMEMPIDFADDIYIHIIFEIKELHPHLLIGYDVYNVEGRSIYRSIINDGEGDKRPIITIGRNHIYSTIPKYFLNKGTYNLDLAAGYYGIGWICEPLNGSPRITLEVKYSNGDCIISPMFQWFNK